MNTNTANRNDATINDIYVTTLIPNRRLIASVIATVMTVAALAVVSLPIHTAAPTMIAGIHVTNFAPVSVSPTASERRAAALLESVATVSPATESAAVAARADLAMPYYAFGTTTSGAASSKE